MHPSRNTAGVPAWLIARARTGLSVFAASTAVRIAVATSSAPATTGGTDDHDQCVDPQDRRGAGATRPRTSPRWPTRAGRQDSEVLASSGRTAESASRVSLGEIGKCEPSRCAGVGTQDPEPARVRYHGDASAARQRLAREQRCRIDEPSSVRARITPACLNNASAAASEPASAAVWELAAWAPAAVVPALEHDDRLATRDTPGDPSELARVAERLEVEQDRGQSRRRPPTTRASRSMRRPPCSRSRRRTRSQAGAPKPARAARGREPHSATRTRSSPSGARSARTSH